MPTLDMSYIICESILCVSILCVNQVNHFFLILDHFNNDAEINLFHERPTDAVGATVTTGVNDDEPDVSEIHQNQQANTD